MTTIMGSSRIKLRFKPGLKGDQGIQGIQGIQGVAGEKGWAPILASVTDGFRRVLQITDWAGGQGTKPASGSYIGPTGLVPDIASAVDIRGPQGPSGSVTDGDKGDIIVSSAGATWTIKPRDGLLASISSAYTIVAGDARKLLSLSGTFTLSATAAATLGAGFLIYLTNEGTDVVTFDPAGSETVDGQSTLTLLSRQSCTLLCDGSNWRTLGYDQSPVIAVRRITSGVASVDIALPTGYSQFEVLIANLTMATVGTSLSYRISDNGGSSYRAGANDYSSFINFTTFSGSTPTGGVLNATAAQIAGAVDSGGNSYRLHASGTFYPGGVAESPSMLHQVTARNTTPAITLASYTTYYPGTTSGSIGRVNAIRFLADSGNINTGTFVIRGVP